MLRLRVISFAIVLFACSALPSPSSDTGRKDGGKAAAPAARFGVGGGLRHFVPELKEAGVQVVREWINWNEIEPAEGRYNWSLMDERVKAANRANIQVLGYFIMTPTWAKKDPRCKADICAIRDMELFGKFARKVAERYAAGSEFGTMTEIEILNEVTFPEFFDFKNTRYEDWLIAGYEGVKAGNSDAIVLNGAFVNPLNAKEFVERMLRDYARYYDVVSYHVYEREKDAEAATEYLKSRMQASKIHKPIWMTETATVPRVSDADAQSSMACGVLKRYAIAFAQGVERVFWWPLNGRPTAQEYSYPPGKEPSPSEKLVGLGWTARGESSEPKYVFHPRPAFATYKLLTSKLHGFSSAAKIADGQYRFAVGSRTVYVLWCDTGTCLPPQELAGTVAVTSCKGVESSLPASKLILGPCPQVVEPD